MGDEFTNYSANMRKQDFPPDWPPLDTRVDVEQYVLGTIFDAQNEQSSVSSTPVNPVSENDAEIYSASNSPLSAAQDIVDEFENESKEISYVSSTSRYNMETSEQISARILQSAVSGNDRIIENNVPKKVASKVVIPDGYTAEFNTYHMSGDSDNELVDIKVTINAESEQAKQNIRLSLAFENNMDVKGIKSNTRYGFYPNKPKNYQFDWTEVREGEYIHNFTYVKPNTTPYNELEQNIEREFFENNQKTYLIENLEVKMNDDGTFKIPKIKLPKGYGMSTEENKYGYVNILVFPVDEEKSFAAKMKYCFAKKIDCTFIGPSRAVGRVPQGESLYGVKVPKGYVDHVEKKDDRAIHNFIYVGENEGNKKSGEDVVSETGEKKKETKRKGSSYSGGESGWKKFTKWLGGLFKSSDEPNFTKQTGKKQKLHRTCRRARAKKIARGEV